MAKREPGTRAFSGNIAEGKKAKKIAWPKNKNKGGKRKPTEETNVVEKKRRLGDEAG